MLNSLKIIALFLCFFAPQLRATALKVHTYNIAYTHNQKSMAVGTSDYFRKNSELVPDIVLWQEVKGRDKAFETFAKRMGNWNSEFESRNGKEKGLGHAVITPFPITYTKFIDFKSQFLIVPKMMFAAEVEVPGIGLVRVSSVHLAFYPFFLLEKVRQEQLEVAFNWLRERDSIVPADLHIFAGDFNALSSGKSLEMMRSAEATYPMSFHDYNNHALKTGGGERIDYIFVGATGSHRGVEFVREEILWNGHKGKKFSDHAGVWHKYKIN